MASGVIAETRLTTTANPPDAVCPGANPEKG
jgi:hypothetical protein